MGLQNQLNNKYMKRENQIQEFVHDCLGQYGVLKYEIKLNDDSDEDYTDFEVVISNDTNKKKCFVVLRSHDYEGGIEILKGEDFYATDKQDFLMYLFLEQFISFQEV